VIEPIARRVAPWWDEWEATFGEARGMAREWSVDIGVANGAMQSWSELDREAGFEREAPGARCLCIRGHSDRSTPTGSTREARRAGKGRKAKRLKG
jgi:hypothetical protein